MLSLLFYLENCSFIWAPLLVLFPLKYWEFFLGCSAGVVFFFKKKKTQLLTFLNPGQLPWNEGYSTDSRISYILALWQTGVYQSCCACSPALPSVSWTVYFATVRQSRVFHGYGCRVLHSPADGDEGVKLRFSNLNVTLQSVTNMNVNQLIREDSSLHVTWLINLRR